MRRRPGLQMALVSVVAVIVGTAIVLVMDWFPEPASTAADDIDFLYDVAMAVSVPIFVLVMAIAGYSIWRWRARPGDASDGEPLHGNTRLEVIWVTVPFILVSALAVYAWILLDDIEAKKPNEMVVNVTGQQFTWSFEYPEQKVKSSDLILPRDQPVEFRVRTRDVLHSFWVPEFRLKTDTVPGITTRIRVTPDRNGSYQVVCTELCGIGHATMRQDLRVVDRAEFDSWVEEKQGGGVSPGGQGGAATAGKQVFNDTGCAGCHTLADADAAGTTGPNLDELADDIPSGTSPEEYIRQSIVDPDARLAEGFERGIMPNDYDEQLDEQQLDQLVQYLVEQTGGNGR